KLKRDAVQRFLANQGGAQARQFAFAQFIEALEERHRHDAVEDAVAEEFQPLVVGLAEAAVSERLLQERGVGERVAEFALQAGQTHPAQFADEASKAISRLTLPAIGTVRSYSISISTRPPCLVMIR